MKVHYFHEFTCVAHSWSTSSVGFHEMI